MSHPFATIRNSRNEVCSVNCYFILDQIKWLSFHIDEILLLFPMFQVVLFVYKCRVSKEYFPAICDDFLAFTVESIMATL